MMHLLPDCWFCNRTDESRLCRRSRVWQLLLLLPLLALFSGCSLFGDDDEEEDPPAELVKFKSTLKVKKMWSAGVGDESEFLQLALVPASDGTNLYAAAHDGRVVAYEAIKGRRLWTTKTKLPLSAGPAINRDLVVVGSSNGDVVALDINDGRKVWQTTVSSEVLASPALSTDLALVRTVDGKLIALDLTDGSERWFAQQSVPRLSVRGTGSPVINGNTVICGFDNGKLAAYDIGDGSLLWDVLLTPPSGRTEVDRLSDLNTTVRVVGDDVYAIGYQGGMSALAAESGQLLWARDISGYSELGVDVANLYVSSDNSTLYALTRSAGKEQWRQDVLLNRDISGPSAYGSSVVVGDFKGYLHWFDSATGELQARVRAGSDRPTAPPLVVNEMLYVLTDAGKLYAFKTISEK